MISVAYWFVFCFIIFYYSDGAPEIGAGYGQGSGLILDDLACEGDESNLEECDHARWGNDTCSHAEDAGVKCCKFQNLHQKNQNPVSQNYTLVKIHLN